MPLGCVFCVRLAQSKAEKPVGVGWLELIFAAAAVVGVRRFHKLWKMQRVTKWRDFCRSIRGVYEFRISFVLKGLKGCFGNDNNLRPIEQPHDSSVKGRLVQHLQERGFCKTQMVLFSGF